MTCGAKEFPNVENILIEPQLIFGRTMIKFTDEPLVFYSDKKLTEKLYDIIKSADYMIPPSCFKTTWSCRSFIDCKT